MRPFPTYPRVSFKDNPSFILIATCCKEIKRIALMQCEECLLCVSSRVKDTYVLQSVLSAKQEGMLITNVNDKDRRRHHYKRLPYRTYPKPRQDQIWKKVDTGIYIAQVLRPTPQPTRRAIPQAIPPPEMAFRSRSPYGKFTADTYGQSERMNPSDVALPFPSPVDTPYRVPHKFLALPKKETSSDDAMNMDRNTWPARTTECHQWSTSYEIIVELGIKKIRLKDLRDKKSHWDLNPDPKIQSLVS